MSKIFPVILSGGSGTRLWPSSRTQYPKQFLRLINHHSLLQNTVLRLKNLPNTGRPLVVANEDHRFLVAEQLYEISYDADIMLEPVAKNTAPAIAAAAEYIRQKGGGILLVLPSDHVITHTETFLNAIATGLDHTSTGKLVTFGITPTEAATGYGYIQGGEPANGGLIIRKFIEKPDATRARQYFESGNYFWNSGMFLFDAETYLQTLERYAPDIAQFAIQSVIQAKRDIDFIRLDKDAFESSPANSIDYAIMEQAKDAIVIPLDAGWNDIGTWDALANSLSTDENGNVLKGDVVAQETNNCVLISESRLLTTIGVDDLILVETVDAVLLAHKSRTQDLKNIVETLRSNNRDEINLHRVVHRPWGNYETLADGERYQVKRIIVKPGASLSLQLHHHRAEHWVVVRGTARIIRDDEVIMLSENQSTFIPLGVKHRLENPGKISLELVEIQSGTYLGEDDIIRFEDNYGR